MYSSTMYPEIVMSNYGDLELRYLSSVEEEEIAYQRKIGNLKTLGKLEQSGSDLMPDELE